MSKWFMIMAVMASAAMAETNEATLVLADVYTMPTNPPISGIGSNDCFTYTFFEKLEARYTYDYSRFEVAIFDAKYIANKDEVIKSLGDSGEICKVYGHQWEPVSWLNGGQPCKVCGAVQVIEIKTRRSSGYRDQNKDSYKLRDDSKGGGE